LFGQEDQDVVFGHDEADRDVQISVEHSLGDCERRVRLTCIDIVVARTGIEPGYERSSAEHDRQ
jgi:hypothetical protein